MSLPHLVLREKQEHRQGVRPFQARSFLSALQSVLLSRAVSCLVPVRRACLRGQVQNRLAHHLSSTITNTIALHYFLCFAELILPLPLQEPYVRRYLLRTVDPLKSLCFHWGPQRRKAFQIIETNFSVNHISTLLN